MNQVDARTKLLEATEQVLLEDGFAALSIRRVTGLAGMNVNAVNYTFGSKDALLRALMLRILEPAIAERMRRLDELVRTPGHTIDDLVRAFLEPLLCAGPEQIALFVELGIKPVLAGDQRFEQTREDRAQAGIGQMVAALTPLLPGVPEEAIAYRVELMLGMSIMHVQNGNRLAGKYGLAAGERDQYLIDDVVCFFSHALTAPTELRPVG